MRSLNIDNNEETIGCDLGLELKELHVKDLATKLFQSQSIYFSNKIRYWTAVDSFLVAIDNHNLMNIFDPTTASIYAVEVGSVSALGSSKGRIILAKNSGEIEVWQFHGELSRVKTLSIVHVNSVKGIVSLNSTIYSCGLDGNVVCYDLETDKVTFSYSEKLSRFIAIYHNGQNVFVLSKSGTISKLTPSLNLMDSVHIANVVTAAVFNKLITVATNESILILNLNLQVICCRKICNVTSIAISERYLAFCCGEVSLIFTIQEFLRNYDTRPGKLFLKSQFKFIDQNWYWAYSTYISTMV